MIKTILPILILLYSSVYGIDLTVQEQQYLEQHPVLTVHNEKNWPPYNFNEYGKPKGFSIDYIELLASKLNIKIKYITKENWFDFIQMLKNNQIDLMLNIRRTKDREKIFNFTTPYVKSPKTIFTNLPNITNLADLNNKTVAVPKNFYIHKFLVKYYPNIKLHLCKSSLEAIKSVINNTSDAVIDSFNVISYLLVTNGLNIRYKTIVKDKRITNYMNIATSKNNKILRDIIQKAMDSVTIQEYNKLSNKWFLFDKNINNDVSLTYEEKEFLKTHPKIVLGTGESWEPYVIKDKTGKIIGLNQDILDRVNKLTGANFVQTTGSWSQMQKDAFNHKIDGLTTLIQTPKRDKWLNFSTTYIDIQKIVMVKAGNQVNIHSPEDMDGKSITIQKNNLLDKRLATQFPNVKIIYADTIKEMLEMVTFGQADTTLGSTATQYKLSLLGLPYMDVAFPVGSPTNIKFAVRKDWPLAISILNKGLSTITQNDIIKLKEKWFYSKRSNKTIPNLLTKQEKEYLQRKKVIKMCNNPNWEPIEFAQNGNINNMQGIAIDTIKEVEKKLGVKFVTVPTNSWLESQQFLKEKKCDILPCAIKTKKREQYALFTKPYLSYKLAIVTKNDKPLVRGVHDIIDKTIARKKGSGLITKLKAKYPDAKIIETKDYLEALKKVSTGEAYCTIATLPIISHYISRFSINNLQIAGYTNMTYNLSMAIRNDQPILKNILDKTLRTIPKSKHDEIYDKWTHIKLQEGIDYHLIWQIFLVAAIIVLFILYRQYILNDLNKKLKIKINEAIQQNREKDQQLMQRNRLAQMGEMLAMIAHQWRQPLSAISSTSATLNIKAQLHTLDDQTVIQLSNNISHYAKHLSSTIDDFRTFFKSNKVKQKTTYDKILQGVLNIIEVSITNKNITIKKELHSKTEFVTYENEIKQVVLNLLKNSEDILVEKNIKEPVIIITTHDNILTIEDNGGGVPDNIIDKIFDPYFSTKLKKDGTGLGLYMSKMIIEDHCGGKLTVHNSKQGAVFKIEL